MNAKSEIVPVDLEQIVDEALAHAKNLGADQAEAAASTEVGLGVSARLREIETLEYQNDRGFGVTVYRGGSTGRASTADFRLESVRRAVEKADSIARQTSSDPCAGLADADMMASEPPDIQLLFPWEIDAARARDLALECEAYALDADPRIDNSEGASISSSSSKRIYGNSHGFRGRDERSRHSVSCAVLASDEKGMERDYFYSVARDAGDLSSLRLVGEEAARRTVARLGARQIKTCQAPVVYSADMARGLLGHAASAMSGSSQYRKHSFLLDAVGEPVFPGWMNWLERPHIDKALGSAGFDSEGVATQNRQLVANGCFQNYILSSYSARRLGLTTTGNAGGLHNMIIESEEGVSDDLLQQLGTGLYVTELMGQGVNPVTGDYSRGAAGFWVEKGEIAFPVSEVTVAGNLREMYANIVAIGDQPDTRGVIQSPPILLSEMTVGGL